MLPTFVPRTLEEFRKECDKSFERLVLVVRLHQAGTSHLTGTP